MVTIDQGIRSLCGFSDRESQSFRLRNLTSPAGFDGKRFCESPNDSGQVESQRRGTWFAGRPAGPRLHAPSHVKERPFFSLFTAENVCLAKCHSLKCVQCHTNHKSGKI